ncbi:MAG TPA: PEP-CTERM sorting domain-containing protein [Phycisphaerae bacterium]|jgi:hypothetical protein
MIRFLSIAFILALASAASAAPSISFTATPLTGGLTAYDFTFHSNDALNSSGFVSITFSSAAGINQVSSILGAVDSSTNAASLNGVGTYLQAPDSWFDTPWALNGISITNFTNGSVSGVGTTATTYGINAGSGTGSQITDALFAHIVSAGPVTWSGSLSRNGVDTPVSGGTSAVPEPAALSLLALAGAPLLATRRKKTARN